MHMSIENKKQFKKWKAEAECASFFGCSLKELDRDDLLAIIGYLVEELEIRQEKFMNCDRDMAKRT